MKKFIYCFNEEQKNKLMAQGYTFICTCNMGKHVAFVFENNAKSLTFSDEDKKQILFSDKMYFRR